MGIVSGTFRKDDPGGREGRFYSELAGQLACRTPHLIERGDGYVVLERLPPARPLEEWTPADLLSGARMLALVHGAFYGVAALHEERPWLPLEPGDLVALVHGDFRPGHLHMAEDGTKWVVSWRRVRLGDPAGELASYAAAATEMRPRLTFDALSASYLEVLRDRLELPADPAHYLRAWEARRGRGRTPGSGRRSAPSRA